MGDILVEPLSLLVLDTTSAPPSRHRYRPGRPVPSAEHDNVVPDAPPTLSRGGCGACGGGETPCQRHVSPRNPIRFETTVDTPSPAAASPHAAPKSGRPQSGRHHVRASVDTTRTLIQSHPPDAFSVGQRLVHRSAAAVPQASVGSGGNHPRLPLHIPDPIHLLLGPLPDTGSDSDVPDLLASHQEG